MTPVHYPVHYGVHYLTAKLYLMDTLFMFMDRPMNTPVHLPWCPSPPKMPNGHRNGHEKSFPFKLICPLSIIFSFKFNKREKREKRALG